MVLICDICGSTERASNIITSLIITGEDEKEITYERFWTLCKVHRYKARIEVKQLLTKTDAIVLEE